MRDGVEGDRGIGDDPLAVVARRLAMHLCAVGGFNAFILDALCRCADLALRLQFDTLGLKAAMVDARINVEFGKPFVDVFGPAFPPAFDHLGAVPVPHLLAETVLVHAAHLRTPPWTQAVFWR